MVIKKSVVRRYLLLSILASIIPVVAVGLLYDRLTDITLEHMLGEKISSHLTATANRLGAFIENRSYQVETLANYPGIVALLKNGVGEQSEELGALLRIESDLPDLYGILFFDAEGKLVRVVPGQAASGSPYWDDRTFDYVRLPVTQVGDTEIFGPKPAVNGESGWFLVRHPIPSRQGERIGGYLGLHVRLASLTEQLGSAAAIGALQPVLRTPVGDFDNVGRVFHAAKHLVPGPEFLPGWRPLLELESSGLIKTFEAERRALLIAVLAGAGLIVFLFYRLSSHLRRRVRQLLLGTQAIANGEWEHRVPEEGDDEITTVSHALNIMSGRLQDYLDKAVRMERLAVLGEFATGIAHEIRNPLAALKTSTQALARREANPKRAQLLGEMELEIDRLANVVSDLVDFGRPRNPRTETISVAEVFRKVVLMTEYQAVDKGIQLSCQGNIDLDIRVDRDQLVQIILNIVINAVQATPGGGAIVLRACRHGGQVSLEVSDTGCGIPDELRERVADPFFTTKSRGVGLGLSISRQLTELNGGQLSIASRTGEGTCVRILLPAA